jgi:hypothetical protein
MSLTEDIAIIRPRASHHRLKKLLLYCSGRRSHWQKYTTKNQRTESQNRRIAELQKFDNTVLILDDLVPIKGHHQSCYHPAAPRLGPLVMPNNENIPPSGAQPLRNALMLGEKKKPCISDCVSPSFADFDDSSRSHPLVSTGRHFGRTVQAFVNIHVLLVNGLFRSAQESQEDQVMSLA